MLVAIIVITAFFIFICCIFYNVGYNRAHKKIIKNQSTPEELGSSSTNTYFGIEIVHYPLNDKWKVIKQGKELWARNQGTFEWTSYGGTIYHSRDKALEDIDLMLEWEGKDVVIYGITKDKKLLIK